MTYEQLMDLAVEVKEKVGVAPIKALLMKYAPNAETRAPKMRDIPAHQWGDVKQDLLRLRDGLKVQGYAYNSTITPLSTQNIYDKMAPYFTGTTVTHKSEGTHRLHNLPHELRSPYAGVPDVDTTAEQVESLAAPRANKTLSGVQVIVSTQEEAAAVVRQLQAEWDLDDAGMPRKLFSFAQAKAMHFTGIRWCADREEAQEFVAFLQKRYDLVDDNAVLRQLMEKMEERHGEEFNAFFEATVRQIMIGSGMTELRIDTGAVLLTLAQSAPMRVSEAPGFLIYELVEDADVSVDR